MKRNITILLLLITVLCTRQAVKAQQYPLEKAKWITAADTTGCPVFQKLFAVKKPVARATLLITAHGLYEAGLNGKKAGDAWFTPGFTSYRKRLQYQSYNISPLIKLGSNQITVTLTGGWYGGLFGEEMNGGHYGGDKSLLCSLVIVYTDGTKETIFSGESWRYGRGPVQKTSFYDGEQTDTRVRTICDRPVKILSFAKDTLVPTLAPPVTEQETFRPRKIWINADGAQLADFGQDMAGWVRLRVKGKAGDTVRIRHAELLDSGRLYTKNLRDAKATDTYILNGREQVLEPHFTYHGFRYASISGMKATKTNSMAIAVHSRLTQTGSFLCGNSRVNQLQHNLLWSMNSNFVDIPTDCPQRSERFGWTGDAQVFCATAALNRNVLNFYRKWLADLKADEGTNGGMPVIIPDFEAQKDTAKGGVAGWGDAATIIPWTLYRVYGDKQVLAGQYASMKAWVDYIEDQSKNNLWKANGYGDWYAMGDRTSLPFIDQCFYCYSVQLLVRAALVLGKQEDVRRFSELAEKVKTAFNETYGRFDTKATRTQTAYVLALQFELLPETGRQQAADSLAKRIRENDNHLATGFLGTPYLLPVLTKYGYTQLAYSLLLQQSCPSWLYPITKGATTIWERWDAIKPDGTIQQCSFNHYAYGAVGQWLYEEVLGIKAGSPGYKTILIAPHPDQRLKWAKGSYTCPCGKIVSEWRVTGHQVNYHIVIPAHTIATLALPGEKVKSVTAGDYHFTIPFTG